MITPRLALVGGTALATAVALAFASPAFADQADTGATTSSTNELAPVTNPADAVVGDHLPEEEVAAQLRSLAGTQPRREIDRILESNVAAAMMTDPETAEVVAAIVLPIDLRTLTPVTPGCTANSACLKNTAGTPFGYEGFGSRTGRWADIRYGYAYGFGATFQWTGGTVRVPSNTYNYWGGPVTVTKISR